METFEQEAGLACRVGKIPNLTLGAYARGGDIQYSADIGPGKPQESSITRATADTPMVLASASKLVTVVAVIQCVECGLLSLDKNVGFILPELANPKVLNVKHTGGDDRSAGSVDSKDPGITLRRLMTHFSGLCYIDDPRMAKEWGHLPEMASIPKAYAAQSVAEKEPLIPTLKEILTWPFRNTVLLNKPGEHFNYGTGLDWAGLMVERVTNMSLEDYCRKHVFNPLNMHSTSFRASHPTVANKLATLYFCNRHTDAREPIEPVHASDFDFGGHGLISTRNDYMRLLIDLTCKKSILLREDTVDYMFGYRTNMPQSTFKDMRNILLYHLIPEGARLDHCLAGAVVDYSPCAGEPMKTAVMWLSVNSIYWWIDREKGICGFYGAHVVANGDQAVNRDMFLNFQRAVHRSFGGSSAKLV